MPPIKVHIDDPITPQKQDSDAETPRRAQEQALPYPPAQPGAAAVPAPTPYTPNARPQPPPTRTTPAGSSEDPPPPQPGAAPVPPGQQAPVTKPDLPPPPKAGESITTMPPQMNVPPPQHNYTPTSSTAYSPAGRVGAGPTTLNMGAVSAPQQIQASSHPPGYQQNVHAQEMSSAARASLDAQERSERFNPQSNSGFGGSGGDSANDAVGNVWSAVKGWASAAGNTLAETEKEVWKRINKD